MIGSEHSEDQGQAVHRNVRKSYITDLWRSDGCSRLGNRDTIKLTQRQKSAES